MIRRVIKICLSAGAVFVSVGCVTIAQPQPPWNEPVDLDLTPAEFKGLVLGLDCGTGSLGKADWTPVNSRACRQIKDLLEQFEAKVGESKTEDAVAAGDRGFDSLEEEAREDQENVGKKSKIDGEQVRDFSLVYVERNASGGVGALAEAQDQEATRVRYGWTLIPCILSMTVIPCVDNSQSHAEIIVIDKDGIIRERYPLRVRYVEMVGIAALYYMIFKPNSDEMTRRLGTHILNIVKTSRVNMEIANVRRRTH